MIWEQLPPQGFPSYNESKCCNLFFLSETCCHQRLGSHSNGFEMESRLFEAASGKHETDRLAFEDQQVIAASSMFETILMCLSHIYQHLEISAALTP